MLSVSKVENNEDFNQFNIGSCETIKKSLQKFEDFIVSD